MSKIIKAQKQNKEIIKKVYNNQPWLSGKVQFKTVLLVKRNTNGK